MCVWTCAGAFDGQNVLVLNLECRKSWFWLVKAHVNDRKSWLKLLIWQKKKKITTWIHSVRPGQWKEKANWKQSKYFFFSPVNLILYSCCSFSYRWQLRWRGTAEAGAASATPELLWGLAGDGVTAMLHPATCDLLRLSGTSDAAGWGYGGVVGYRSDRWSHWILSVQLWPADRWDGLLSQRRAMTQPTPLWSIEAFPYGLSSPALAHALFCVSFFSPEFHFINVSLTVLTLSDFLWTSTFFSFVAFSVLVWFGLRLLCVWSSVSPSWVRVFFQSSVLIWWCLCF